MKKDIITCKTTSAVGILAAYRDNLLQQAENLITPIEHKINALKQDLHEAKIEANKLKKKAAIIQQTITQEMQDQYNEEQILKAQYKFKTSSDFAAEYQLNGTK